MGWLSGIRAYVLGTCETGHSLVGGLVAWLQRNRLLDVIESLCGSTSRECFIEWDFLKLVREIDLVAFELDLHNPIVVFVDDGVFAVAGRAVVSTRRPRSHILGCRRVAT